MRQVLLVDVHASIGDRQQSWENVRGLHFAVEKLTGKLQLEDVVIGDADNTEDDSE